MRLKIYEYKSCSSCRKARAYLDTRGVTYARLPVRETPPSRAELKRMLHYLDGQTRKLFNTAGMDYRILKLKDKLPGMTETEILDLLTANGNLVKRPFLIGPDCGTVGFDAKTWDQLPLDASAQ